MKKLFLFITIIIFIISILSSCTSKFYFFNKIILKNNFVLTIPKEIKFETIDSNWKTEYINIYKQDEYDKMVRYSYFLKYKNHHINLDIYLKPKINISIDELKIFTNINNVSDSNAGFGMGDIYKVLKKDSDNTRQIKIKNRIITKYLSSWGSGVSRDILVYNFEISNKVFNNCIIQFLNVWPDENNYLPKNYNIKFVENLIQKKDSNIEIYNLLDDSIKKIKFLDDFK